MLVPCCTQGAALQVLDPKQRPGFAGPDFRTVSLQSSDSSDWITRYRRAVQAGAAFQTGLSATPEAIPPPG
jgi:hypothetical protein